MWTMCKQYVIDVVLESLLQILNMSLTIFLVFLLLILNMFCFLGKTNIFSYIGIL